ncbi:hypothetical protein [Clostridium felsineum]|uniref:Uncharacterized protein n=1 Tax=Clostridium felsineum TaxID=36839 RepID=A0A1S8L1N1_9CLOT|nr:hypothetical protein [Clostridium felsineum]URZ04772.1 hypothetical protein CLROS_000870 [Clostridium felsineum]URZ09813.1 hypothetical protein CROST_005120 [Clostridium felsineum]
MNFNRKKYIRLIATLIITVCFSTGCSNNSSKEASSSIKEVSNFIDKNHEYVNLNQKISNKSFSIMDEDIKKNGVILTGEDHATSKSFKVQLALLIYLNKKYKLKYSLAKLPACTKGNKTSFK